MSRSPSKAPLITPSPSPAIRPPQKKPRLDIDVNEARAASTSRMLDVWAQLADRYSRRLDEDDVIDLNTGQIVKDRGVIKSIPNKWEFGRFADEQSQNEEEDSGDELDTLPRTEPTVQNEVEEEQPVGTATEVLQSRVRRVRALDLTNADDAEDLKEFLAAEQRRKELCGKDDSDSDEDEDELATLQNTQSPTHLRTPPASLTPDEHLVPLASSSQSSKLRSRTSSVTKRAVPTKRATSKPSEEPKATQPKSLMKVSKEKTPAPSSSPKKTIVDAVVTRSQSRVPEDPPSNRKKVESAPASRKGKEKAAVDSPREKQIVYVSDSESGSDDEIAVLDPVPFTSKTGPVASSSSVKLTPEKKTKQREELKKVAKEESKKAAKEESKKESKPAKGESKRPAKEDSSEPPSKGTRKRKRAASSSEPSSPGTSKTGDRRANSSEPSPTATTKRKHLKQHSKSKSKARHSDSASDSESPRPRSHRARSHFSTVPESYYPYPPPPSEHGPPHYVPLFHPQAQFIISNAMHQLSTLFSSQSYPLPHVPFPLPGHGKHPYPTSSPYHTPRRHAESYYDPAFSHGTLPPSSPEPDSSPIRGRSDDKPRHSSLVSRSHSRGRRVSFKMQEGADDVQFVNDEKSSKKRDNQESPPVDHLRKEGSSRKVGKAKSKARVLESVSDSQAEDASPRRGRSSRRGQTPAPPMRSDSESPCASRKRR